VGTLWLKTDSGLVQVAGGASVSDHGDLTGVTSDQHHPQLHVLDSHTDVDATTPTNNERLAWDAATLTWIPKQSISALGLVSFHYDFNTILTDSISSGDVSLNNGTQPSATELYISAVTNEGDDISLFLENLTAESWINLYDQSDTAQFISFDVAAPPAENAGVWTIPVSFFGQAGAALSNNQKLSVLFRFVQPAHDTDHNDLVNVTPDQHHTKYTDGEAVAAGVGTFVSSVELRTMKQLTQAEYDGLTPDAETLYIIVG